MDRTRKPDAARRSLDDYRPGRAVTIEEIQDVMADEGYSASRRKGWLKSVLTDLEQGEADDLADERRNLINAIKDIMDHHQSGESNTKKV